ncbi:hypothetical protein PPYR_01527 [Photinus pyralis]|uniref:Odorant receptor n=1 Tax=Photinus pyralis TaxID=7054 RepID=A0A5N4B4L4_PHOPY|nr:odorant receptor 94a-like isoform X1 [Photinus pyralis]KAB0804557.1 hypothetical protein PPYR_01527 [Photinus pyralis]
MAISLNSNAFKIQKRLMIMTGLWPRRDSGTLYRIYGASHYWLLATFSLSLLLSTMVVKDFSQLIQGWSMFVAILNCVIKFTIFYFKMPVFLDLLDFLHSPHFSYHKDEVDHHLKRIIDFAIAVVKLFLCSCVTTVFCMITTPLFASKGTRLTPLPFPLDFEKHSFLTYISVYLYQCLGLASACCSSIGFDNLSTSMMGLCSAYFAILTETIISTTNEFQKKANENHIRSYEKFDEQVYSDLSQCVEHHLAVIKFTETIENIFSYVFLSQFLCSAFGICLAGFTSINAKPGSVEFIFALSFLGTLMFQITLYCSYGNEVTIQSYRVLEACYMTEWVYRGPKVRQNLFLIMERSKRPMVMTAGKFVNLSLSSLVSVFRSAASYAMVLYQLYNA